jgi:hypothetical protein
VPLGAQSAGHVQHAQGREDVVSLVELDVGQRDAQNCLRLAPVRAERASLHRSAYPRAWSGRCGATHLGSTGRRPAAQRNAGGGCGAGGTGASQAALALLGRHGRCPGGTGAPRAAGRGRGDRGGGSAGGGRFGRRREHGATAPGPVGAGVRSARPAAGLGRGRPHRHPHVEASGRASVATGRAPHTAGPGRSGCTGLAAVGDAASAL